MEISKTGNHSNVRGMHTRVCAVRVLDERAVSVRCGEILYLPVVVPFPVFFCSSARRGSALGPLFCCVLRGLRAQELVLSAVRPGRALSSASFIDTFLCRPSAASPAFPTLTSPSRPPPRPLACPPTTTPSRTLSPPPTPPAPLSPRPTVTSCLPMSTAPWPKRVADRMGTVWNRKREQICCMPGTDRGSRGHIRVTRNSTRKMRRAEHYCWHRRHA